jgi:hypothetical protein
VSSAERVQKAVESIGGEAPGEDLVTDGGKKDIAEQFLEKDQGTGHVGGVPVSLSACVGSRVVVRVNEPPARVKLALVA